MSADSEHELRQQIKVLQARLDRANLIAQVSNVIHSTLEPHAALQLIVREAVHALGAISGSVVLINPTTGFLEIQAAFGLPPKSEALKLRVGEGITGWVARHGKIARVGDVRQDRRYIMVKDNVLSELAVPLEVNGELRGVINLDSDKLDAFGEDEERLLFELSIQAAKVIQNTWLYEQLRLRARWFESLFSVGQTINSTLNLDEALQVITREACALMEAKMCSLLLLDETGDWLDLRASHGAGPAYITKPRLSASESFVGVVVRRKKPLQVENVQISTRYQNVSVARTEGLVSLLSVPLLFGGRAIGVLNIYTSNPHSFSNQEIRVLAALAELSGIAIEKARLYERIVDMEEELRQNEKLSAIGLLAAEVAHEIRNPLTVMKMLYHSLDLRFPQNDPRARDAIVMGEKMEHLNRIVEQVLDFARTAEPDLQTVQINKLIDDLRLLTRHKLSQHKITASYKLAPDLPAIIADGAQLEQAFLNLTLNAVEAMPNGGKLAIVTRLVPGREGGARIVIRFSDTGMGMSAEQRERVFSSLLSTTKKKGTGLGLAIVRKIVEVHQGEISVRSHPNRGTTFSLSFPVNRAS